MCDVFCPACNGPVGVLPLVVVTIRRHHEIGHEILNNYGDCAICTCCSLISEVGERGYLIDLGAYTLEDLQAPFVPGMFEPRVLIPSGTSRLWDRRDS